jgi:beta-glucosidase
MKKMRRAPAALFALAASACGPGQKITLEVMTMNLRHDVDFWEERFPMIASEIAALQPDLIGLQEVELAQQQGPILQQMIGLDYLLHEEAKTGLAVLGGEGIGSLSRHPVLTKGTVDLQYGRPATFDRVQVGELTVDFYNTHLHNEGGDEVRAPQMRALLDFIAANDAGHVTFLTGDMNAKDDTETIRLALEAGFIDTFPAVHGAETANIGNTVPIHLDKRADKQRATSRIDYVFVRGQGVHVVSSTVAFNRRNAELLYPSDHLGVMSTFEIETP